MAQRVRKGLYVKVTFAFMPKKLIRCQLCQDLQRGSFLSQRNKQSKKMHRDENEWLEEDACDWDERGRKECAGEVWVAQSRQRTRCL